MRINTIKTLSNYYDYSNSTRFSYERHLESLRSFVPDSEVEFTTWGYSYPAGKMVNFINNFKHSDGWPNLNWRECVFCPITWLNNRMRAAIHFFDLFSNSHDMSNVYIMEQTTPVFNYLNLRFPNLVGSEFLGHGVELGGLNEKGIRNEDSTRLTFDSKSLDVVLSFDVFEHVYNYKQAFSECSRVLRPGGCLIFTVPFSNESNANIERAIHKENGEIHHLLPPEYHGDPLSNKGILSYRQYGWNMLNELLDAGFSESYAAIFNSIKFGYYTNQLIFFAKK